MIEVDWKFIGHDLRRCGYGLTRIAIALNKPKSTVQSWINRGSEPAYSDGQMLLSLWRKVVLGERVKVKFFAPVSANRRNCGTPAATDGVSTSLTGRDASSNRAPV